MIKKLFSHKVIRFLFVGGLNTLVGYGVFALLVYLGVFYQLANLVSFIVGVSHSYLWNKFFTFKSKERSLPEAFRFFLVYGLSFIVSTLALLLMVQVMRLDTYISGIINVLIITCFSWFGHNFFSFKNSQLETGVKHGGPHGKF